MGGRGSLQRRPRSVAPVVRDRASAAERDRRPPSGPRAPALARRHDRAHEAHAGLQRALPARLRPRGHLDTERRREAPRARGEDAARPRSRGVRGARLGMAARVRRQDHGAVPPDRRLARLSPRALHDGRRVRPRRDAVLRPPLGEGLDLPREPDRQLVPVPPDLALRPRGRPRRGRRRAHLRALPAGAVGRRARRRSHHDRDGAAGDDPRRRRGRGAPGRRSLQAARRARGDRAVRRTARAGDRRRARRDELRHGRAEDHACARPDRLRDRPRP